MADLYLGESAAPVESTGPGAMSGLINWAGALTSVALIAGLAIWGYQLTVRDVSGVPVVRALEGPMRVAPEEPGGETMDHQGLAVNSVAADGSAEGPAERLILAPPALELTDEDVPAVLTEVLPEAGEEPVEEVVPLRATEDDMPAQEDTDVLALADRLAGEATPLDPLPEADAPSAITLIPESVKGVARSPFPLPRPGYVAARVENEVTISDEDDATARAVAESVTLAVTPQSVEVAPEDVASGARLVQFGAFASPDEARQEWQRLDKKFTAFLVDKKRVIEKAVSGGKTFYRLRAMGFDDISDARRFCSAFVAERQACIPVVAR